MILRFIVTLTIHGNCICFRWMLDDLSTYSHWAMDFFMDLSQNLRRKIPMNSPCFIDPCDLHGGSAPTHGRRLPTSGSGEILACHGLAAWCHWLVKECEENEGNVGLSSSENGGTPLIAQGKSQSFKWMMTGGSPSLGNPQFCHRGWD